MTKHEMMGLGMVAALALAPNMATAALAVGAKAPDFTTRGAMNGKVMTVKLSDQLKKGPVVLYFFPAANTAGCDAEANAFAESIDGFKKAGATVIGMSGDTVDKLTEYSTTECRSKFTVASAGPNVVKGYDVALSMPGRPELSGRTNRTTYVIAPTGRITYAFSALRPDGHVANSLAAVQQMRGARAK